MEGQVEPKWRLEASLEGLVESKRRLEASLDGKMESKWRLEASLKAKLASKWRLEASWKAQVASRRAFCGARRPVGGPKWRPRGAQVALGSATLRPIRKTVYRKRRYDSNIVIQ